MGVTHCHEAPCWEDQTLEEAEALGRRPLAQPPRWNMRPSNSRLETWGGGGLRF